eukprot:TRINITY_DN983_c0_g1_i1.p1 TRINITY_DN983_c0_g1~~TRINITY_DN983_c0_g1_i1.p1  ORF type:complete len:391 (+),score=84.53 TRINITY_DN983_c0_g1_i1:553-1725(+)
MTPSVMSNTGQLPADEETRTEVLKDNLELLTEKRAAVRTAALGTINKILSMHYCDAFVENRAETMHEYLISSFKKRDRKGAEKEAISRCFKIFYITYGQEGDSLYLDAEEQLVPFAKSAKSAGDSALALEMLSVACFIACEEEDRTRALMDLCASKLTSATNATLLTSALRAWALLATSLSKAECVQAGSALVKPLSNMLSKDNGDLVLVAGQCLALIYEAHWIAQGESDKYDKGALQRQVDINHVIGELKDLAIDNSRYKSKKDLSEQRSNFKALHRIVEDGEVPEVKLKVGQNVVEFDQWSTILQYETLKDILAAGFQAHCKYNQLVRDILELEGYHTDETNTMSALEKRKYLSKNSSVKKQWTRDRLSDRDKNNRTRRMSHLDEASG